MKYGAFLNRKSLTRGTTRRSAAFLAPASSSFKSVCLHDWWLIKPQEGDEGLAVAGFSSREGMSVRAFKSAAILKRHDATTLETVDGFTISLVGFINKDLTLQNGFSSEVCSLFQFGFSYDWGEYTVRGSNKVLTNGLNAHTFENCSIDIRKDPRPEDSDPWMHSHPESDCHILTRKAMEDLFECVRDLEQSGSISFLNGKNVHTSDGVKMPPGGTMLNNSHSCLLGGGKLSSNTEALEKSFQLESCEDPPSSTQPGHVNKHPESDHVLLPNKRKQDSFIGKFCNSASTIELVESRTTLEAGCTPRTISGKPIGSRRITRSMTKEKKNCP